MEGESVGRPTRRGYVKGASTVLGGGLLAGCTGGGSTTTADGTTGSPSGTDGSYSATLAPVGTVEFERAPERLGVVFPQYADAAVALGHGDGVASLYAPEMSGTVMNRYYDRLEGVSFEWTGLPDPLKNGFSKERLYQLNSDVHFVDPAYVVSTDNWDRSDVEEVRKNAAPWFGNFYSGTRGRPPEAYREGYEYYGLWEIVGEVARVLGERERYEKLAAIRRDLRSTIRSKLPPKAERPTAVRVTYSASEETFYAYHINAPGFWQADTRPLAAKDAFADRNWSGLWGNLDYEALLAADPDVILHLWGTAPGYEMSSIRDEIANHPIGGRLSAARNDRIHANGMRYQGPIMNLFQLEMVAKQLYPEQFGEWPTDEDGGSYPEIPRDERLFDRRRLAAVVTGNA